MKHATISFVLAVLISTLMTAVPAVAAPALSPKDFARDVKFIKRSKNLALGGYKVMLTVADGTYAEGRGGSGARADLMVSLQGIDETMLQDIADAAHQDLLEKLGSTDKNIIPFEEIAAADGFSDLPTETSPFYTSLGGRRVAMVGPSDRPLWFTHYDTPFSSVGMMDLKPWRNVNAVSAKTKAVIIVPQVSIHFADLETSGRSTIGGTASVGAKPNLRIMEGESGIKNYFAKIKIAGDLGHGATKKDIVLDSSVGEMVTLDEQTKDLAPLNYWGERAETKITGAYRVDPEQFKAEVLRGIARFNDSIIGVIDKY